MIISISKSFTKYLVEQLLYVLFKEQILIYLSNLMVYFTCELNFLP